MNTFETKSFFTQEQQDRIVGHMNEDHADAVLNYAKRLAQKTDALSAKLLGIDQEGIELEVETEVGLEPVRIDFTTPLESPEDARPALVAMAQEARKKTNAIDRAQATINAFRSDFQTVILGTAAPEGTPDASVAPAVVGPDDAFYTFVSDLSSHTRNMADTAKASVLIIEDESQSSQLLARRRLAFSCAASEVIKDDPVYQARMEDLQSKFGPAMMHISDMADFHMYRLAPQGGRLINGFGQAFDVNPRNWNDLKQLGSGTGHGHRAKKEIQDQTTRTARNASFEND